MKKSLAFGQHFPGLLTVSCGSHSQYQDSPVAQPVQRLVLVDLLRALPVVDGISGPASDRRDEKW
jgi:hypothetical protein